ncbi:22876_t:CDS:2, partial [Racocetra persica]
ATLGDIEIIYDVCWMLTPSQIQKLISHYFVADYENPISPEILKAVASRVTANDRKDILLLDTTPLEDSGPFEVPLPREVHPPDNYVPACTLFVTANGNDKISQLKKDILKQLGIDIKIKLYRADNSNPPNFTSLEPTQNGEDPSIAKLGLVDEQILYLVFWDDKNGRFENVSFELPEPLPDEEDDDEIEP